MGGCGTHYYENITRQIVDAMINELLTSGATITGENPWHVNTNQSGVKLIGEYTEENLTLAVTATDHDWYVPCSMVWERVDTLIHQIREIPDIETHEA